MLFLAIFGVLAFYFFAIMNVYKSMYHKIKEEKDFISSSNDTKSNEIKKYESQLNDSLDTIKYLNKRLEKAKEEIKDEKLVNAELKQKNDLLQKRVDELYSSMGMI